MTTLMQASRQWATRPADERYASLLDMQSTMTRRRERSRASVESTRALTVLPDESDPLHRGLYLGIERGPLAGQLLALGLRADLQPRGDAVTGIVFPREQSASRHHRGCAELQPALHARCRGDRRARDDGR